MQNLIFTYHAAVRWFERFPKAVFESEIASAKRCREQERLERIKGRKTKCYRTVSNIILVVRRNLVITCYRVNHLYKK